MTNENRKHRAQKRRSVAMLLVLLILLVFGIIKMTAKQNETDMSSVMSDMTEPSTTPYLTFNMTDSSRTDPSAEVPSGLDEQETTGEDTIPVHVSASGNIQCDHSRVYVRVNHSQKLVLHLSGGLKQSDVVWSVDDDHVADVTNGVVTGLQKGTCVVTAHCGDDYLEIPVTVRELSVQDGCTYVDGILVVNKSYSLPRDYDPGLLPVTEEAFQALSDAAAAEGLNIYIGSDYRDYDFQVTVYNSMVNGYSKEYADALSARPGHSEHQSGYTIDCNTIENDFAETDEGKWLAAHCHEYGFIIRYPKGKESITGYEYESWHIRYVGVEAATEMYKQGLTLEEYLDVTSEYAQEDEQASSEIS